MITCIALASKAEDCQWVATLEELLAHPAVVAEVGQSKAENVLSIVGTELTLLQGTRFHLMIHHPYALCGVGSMPWRSTSHQS